MVVGYTSVCSGAEGGRREKTGVHGAGPAVEESFVTGVDKGAASWRSASVPRSRWKKFVS